MNTTNITIEHIDSFLKGTEHLDVAVGDTIEEKYRWIREILIKTRYQLVRRKEKTLVRKFLVRCTGYSESHIDHLISEFRKTRHIKRKGRDCPTEYATLYTRTDIEFLAKVSEAYFHQNGKALKAILSDMYHVYGDAWKNTEGVQGVLHSRGETHISP